MKIREFVLLLLALSLTPVLAQDQARIMTYNLLNYSSSDTSRDASFRSVLQHANPDILVVQEITSQAAVNQFYNKVLNLIAPGTYTAGAFVDGPDPTTLFFTAHHSLPFFPTRR